MKPSAVVDIAADRRAAPVVLGGAKAWSVWLVAVAFVIYLFSFQTGYSIVNPAVQRDTGMTVAQVGLVAAIYTWSFAVFQLFSGALLDRFGARRVLLPAIALFVLGIFLFANAPGISMLVAAQLVLAFGACAGFVGAGYVGGQWFGMARFSFMFGLVQCLASLFSAFSQNLLGLALTAFEWRQLFNGIGCAGIGLFVLALWAIRDPAPPPGLAGGLLGGFVRQVFASILEVARIGQVWIAAGYGALAFGSMLACGVVWAAKLMLMRGWAPEVANFATSALWLGLAAGCLALPWWSDAIGRRKLPAIVGIAVQLASLTALVYAPQLNLTLSILLCIAFGFGAAAHMLAFSVAGDIVKPALIGTSASIVNGVMFLVSGLLIARPGSIISQALAANMPVSLELAELAARPLIVGLVLALVLASVIRESHPRAAR